jgi:energy-converting hydrogenase Eha subunit E
MKTIRNLKFLAAALAFVVGAGTAGFHYIEGWSWFDGFYMVINTLTTIGDQTHPLSHAGRVFNIIIIIIGVGLVFLAIGDFLIAMGEPQQLRELELTAGSEPSGSRSSGSQV